jgi:hypothetical protein
MSEFEPTKMNCCALCAKDISPCVNHSNGAVFVAVQIDDVQQGRRICSDCATDVYAKTQSQLFNT